MTPVRTPDAGFSLAAARSVLERARNDPGSPTPFPSKLKPHAELLREMESLVRAGGDGRTASRPLASTESNDIQSLLRQKASLELRLQQESAARRDIETTLARQTDEHRTAMESLAFQQRKLGELQEERSRLLGEIRRLEDQFRTQINETEQVTLKLQKLQDSRKTLGDQSVSQTEQINSLQAENESLRKQLEAAFRDRDQTRQTAAVEVQAAESQTADAAFAALWEAMGKQLPQVFTQTHVPNIRTFENVCEAFVELARIMAVLEAHVHQMLRDLRQVGETGDKLAHFHVLFTKNPDVLSTLRDFLTSRKRTGNFANLARALQAWARGFGSGCYKAIARSPVLVGQELNYRNWPLKRGSFESEDAALVRYFRETASKAIPDKVGTLLRREAGDLSYQDYNDLVKRVR